MPDPDACTDPRQWTRFRSSGEQRRKGLHTDEAKSSLAAFLGSFLESYKTEGGVSLRTWQDYRYQVEVNVIPKIGGDRARGAEAAAR